MRMLSGFLVVQAIAPEIYGQFSGVGIFLGYILIGHGGIINGLSRELPYELGRGNEEEAKKMASSVFFLSIFISILSALFFLSFSLYYFICSEFKTGVIYSSYSLMASIHLINKQFLPVLYRTNKDFNKLSKQNILLGLGNLVTVSFVWLWGFWGLCIRGIVLYLFEFFLLFKGKPYRLKIEYNLAHYKKLFKTGFPIFMVGQINPLWATIMNNIIFSVGGAAYYGLYALSTIVQGAVGVIPASFSSVIYPRMSIMLGQGKTVSQILKSNIRSLFFQFGVMLSIAIVGVFLLPIVIPFLLPKYTEGIPAAQWMLFVPVAMSFGALANIYNVVKKQGWYFVSLITGALVGSLFVYLQIKPNGFYLEVFPQGMLLGIAIQQILSIGFIKLLLRNE